MGKGRKHLKRKAYIDNDGFSLKDGCRGACPVCEVGKIYKTRWVDLLQRQRRESNVRRKKAKDSVYRHPIKPHLCLSKSQIS